MRDKAITTIKAECPSCAESFDVRVFESDIEE